MPQSETDHTHHPDAATLPARLRRARELADVSERSAARALGVGRSTLRSWESGRAAPDADQLDAAVRLYGADLDRIWPNRQPLVGDDVALGHLVVGDERISLGADDTGLVPDNRTILVRYLAAVRRERGLAPREDLPLRGEDLAALAAVLDLSDDSLAATMAELLDLTPTGTRMTMRALAVGSLMALGAGGLVGASWLSPTSPTAAAGEAIDGSRSATAAAVTADEFVEPGGAVEISSGAVEISTRAVEQIAAPERASADGAEIAAARERLPFTTEPTAPRAPDEMTEIGEAMFAVAPATEWTPVPDDLFSVDPTGTTATGATREQPAPSTAIGPGTAELPPASH